MSACLDRGPGGVRGVELDHVGGVVPGDARRGAGLRAIAVRGGTGRADDEDDLRDRLGVVDAAAKAPGADRPTSEQGREDGSAKSSHDRGHTPGGVEKGTPGVVIRTILFPAIIRAVIRALAVPPRTDSRTIESMPNRLAGETSPYLLQHAHNPVDWFPWGPEALAARDARSTGRSSCRSATPPATGVTSWNASRSSTSRRRATSTSTSSRSRSIARSGRTSTRCTWPPSSR